MFEDKTLTVQIGSSYSLALYDHWDVPQDDNGNWLWPPDEAWPGYRFTGWTKTPNCYGAALEEEHKTGLTYNWRSANNYDNSLSQTQVAGNENVHYYAIWRALCPNFYIKDTGNDTKGRYNNLRLCPAFRKTSQQVVPYTLGGFGDVYSVGRLEENLNVHPQADAGGMWDYKWAFSVGS